MHRLARRISLSPSLSRRPVTAWRALSSSSLRLGVNSDWRDQVSSSPFLGFDHVHFWVGNSKQAAAYYISRFGFEPLAYRGLETGSRDVATTVIRQGRITFAFSSALRPGNGTFSAQLERHGDGVKDVAFEVKDCKAVYDAAIAKGARSIKAPEELEDENGTVVVATVEAYTDTWHTLVQRTNYKGPFLPGFAKSADDPLTALRPKAGLDIIDHVVSNQNDGQMEPVVNWYMEKFGFHRFWSVDDKDIHTEYSSLRSVVVADPAEVIKMPINEPAPGKRKSQIEEYCEYYGGGGIQHIALNTPDIIQAITNLKACGVSFIQIPDSYYDLIRSRLSETSLEVDEDLATIQRLGILIDFDETGYLLQTFTRPQQDRPTLFLEVIQRHGLGGFGVGNFKSLFEAIERDQSLRGNL